LNLGLHGAICLAFLASVVPESALNALPASVELTPQMLDFGGRASGIAGAPETATLRNNTATPLKISAIFVSGIDFSQTNSCGQILAAGNGCAIQVIFKPATTGPREGTLNVQASVPQSLIVVLSGTGE
jgi:hypothetical protein